MQDTGAHPDACAHMHICVPSAILLQLLCWGRVAVAAMAEQPPRPPMLRPRASIFHAPGVGAPPAQPAPEAPAAAWVPPTAKAPPFKAPPAAPPSAIGAPPGPAAPAAAIGAPPAPAAPASPVIEAPGGSSSGCHICMHFYLMLMRWWESLACIM